MGGNGAENRGWSGALGVETEIEKGSKYQWAILMGVFG